MAPSRHEDRQFMAEAIRLGLAHRGLTDTNPSVGCLIVKDGTIFGRGVTAIGGRPHAEVQALADAGDKARGATVYVSLEPCSHHGKTPPCAEALIAAGVSRVVVSLADPDRRVEGRGLDMLAKAGIEVDVGLLQEEAQHSLIAYLTRQIKQRPYVTLKLAISADGMIGRKGEGQIAISGPEARVEVQHLRAENDAILVGIGTALADDPLLTVRLPGEEYRSPMRIILDPQAVLPLDSKLVRTARQVPLIVVTAQTSEENRPEDAYWQRREALAQAGAEVLECDPVHPGALLGALASRGISSLLVEGGAKTARRFLDAGLVDRILLYRGQLRLGQGGIESPVSNTDMPGDFDLREQRPVGSDQRFEFEKGF